MDSVLERNPGMNLGAFLVLDSSLQLVIIQFTAMGFVEVFNAIDNDGKTYKQVNLTPSGHQYLISVSAVKRGVVARVRPVADEAEHTKDDLDASDL